MKQEKSEQTLTFPNSQIWDLVKFVRIILCDYKEFIEQQPQ